METISIFIVPVYLSQSRNYFKLITTDTPSLRRSIQLPST